jgi:hypothetical protein
MAEAGRQRSRFEWHIQIGDDEIAGSGGEFLSTTREPCARGETSVGVARAEGRRYAPRGDRASRKPPVLFLNRILAVIEAGAHQA